MSPRVKAAADFINRTPKTRCLNCSGDMKNPKHWLVTHYEDHIGSMWSREEWLTDDELIALAIKQGWQEEA